MVRGRRILAYAGIGAVAVMALSGAGLIALDTGAGRALVARTVAAALSSPGSTVDVGAVSGSLWDTMRIDRVAVADRDGPWLEVEGLALGWRPSALLRGRVAVDRLAAAQVTILRAPQPQPATPGPNGPPGIPWPPPRLPVDVVVERIDIATLSLAEPVLGAAVAIGIDGALAIDGDVRARLDVARQDGKAGGARLEAAYGRDDRRLRVSLAVDEPPGGLIARLLAQPDLPAVAIGLEGEGTIPGFVGRLTARLGERATLETAVAIEGGAEAPVLRLDGRAEVAGLLEGTAAALLAGGVSFEIAVQEDGEAIALRSARLVAAGLHFDATARVHPETLDGRAAIAVALAGDASAAAPLAPLGFAAARLSVAADGNLLRAPLDITAAIERAAIEGMRAGSIDLAARLAPGTTWTDPALALRADATVRTQAVAFDALVAGTAIGATPSLRLGARLDASRLQASDISLSLEGAAASVQASGDIGADGGTLTLTGDLQRLEALAPGVLGKGALTFAATVATPGRAAGTTVDAVIDGRGLATVDPALRGILGAAPKLEASVRLGDGMTIAVQALQITAAGAVANVQGKLNPDGAGTDLRYRLRLDDLAAALPSAAGGIEASGRVHGALADPSLTLRINAGRLAAGGIELTDIDGSVELASLAVRPHGSLRLGAGGTLGRIAVETAIAAPDAQRIRLSALRVRAGDARIDGALTVNRMGPVIDGRLHTNRIALAPWSRLAGTALEGTATAEITFTPDGPRTRARARVEGGGIAAAGIRLDRLATEVSTPDALAARTVRLEQLSARLAGETVTLRRPATFSLAPGAVAIEGLRLGLNGGEIVAEGAIRPDGVRAEVSIARLPLALIDALALRQGLTGRADARLALSGPVQDVGGTLTLNLTDVRAGGKAAATLPAASAELRATLGAGRLEATARIAAGAGTAVDSTAVLPLRLAAAPFAANLEQDAPMFIDAKAQGNVGRIWERLPFPTQRLAGNLDAAVQVRGTPGSPSVSGQLTLRNGEYEHLLLGTLLRELTLDVVADGRTIMIRRGTARDARDGQLALSGVVDLTPGRDMPIDLNATLTRFTLFNRAEGTASASGAVSIAGAGDRRELQARLRTDRAELRIEERPPPTVVSLDVTEVGGGRPPPPPPEPIPTSAPLPLKLDIVVEVPGQAFARGRGLDSEWAGRVAVTGTADAPKVDGELRVVRGQFEVIGKAFRLTEGRIDLTGFPDAEPTIALTAEYSASALTAIVRAAGKASNPTITLSSQPEVPQDEILARILYDKSAGRLSALEAAQLADAVATFSGSGSGGFLDRMRRTLGVDVLRVGAGEDDSSATLSVGKYLSEGVYVGLDRGTGSGTGAATVEIEVTPNITVESSFGTDSRVGVKWKWDY